VWPPSTASIDSFEIFSLFPQDSKLAGPPMPYPRYGPAVVSVGRSVKILSTAIVGTDTQLLWLLL
jgi:hypothetical protein